MVFSTGCRSAVASARAHEQAKLKKISEILSRCRVDDPCGPLLQQEIDVICARLVRLRALGGPEAMPANGKGHGAGLHETGLLECAVAASMLADVRGRSAAFYQDLADRVKEADLAELFRAASGEDAGLSGDNRSPGI